MFIRDVLQLSFKKSTRQFRRSYKLLVVMSAVFILIFTMNLLFTGFTNSYIKLAETGTDGKVIISAKEMNAINLGKKYQKVGVAAIKQDIESYGGKTIAGVRRVGAYGLPILDRELVSDLIEIELTHVPVDAIPILASTFLGEQLLGQQFKESEIGSNNSTLNYSSKLISKYHKFRERLLGHAFEDHYGTKYYVVGFVPDNYHLSNFSFYQFEHVDTSLLNPILENVATIVNSTIAIDNGKEQFWQVGKRFIRVLDQENLDTSRIEVNSLQDSLNISDIPVFAVFDNQKDAYRYFSYGKGSFPATSFEDKEYSVDIVLGLSPDTTYLFQISQNILRITSVVLFVVAAAIIISTGTRLIIEDRTEISLMSTLGATKRQIKIFYLLYLVELIIGALVFAFLVSSVILWLFHLSRGEMINIQAILGFGLKDTPRIFWYGLNIDLLMLIFASLLLAPLVVLLNSKKHLSV